MTVSSHCRPGSPGNRRSRHQPARAARELGVGRSTVRGRVGPLVPREPLRLGLVTCAEDRSVGAQGSGDLRGGPALRHQRAPRFQVSDRARMASGDPAHASPPLPGPRARPRRRPLRVLDMAVSTHGIHGRLSAGSANRFSTTKPPPRRGLLKCAMLGWNQRARLYHNEQTARNPDVPAQRQPHVGRADRSRSRPEPRRRHSWSAPRWRGSSIDAAVEARARRRRHAA